MPTGSNVITTTSTTRADMGEDLVLDGYLKDVYGPGITNTLFLDDGFTRLIKKSTRGLQGATARGRRIIRQFATQRSAGVGPIAEGGDFRDSVPVDGAQGTEWIKHLNLYFSLSGPVIRTVKEGEGSYVDSINEHVRTIGESAKLDLERQLMGQQDGRLCQINDSTPTGTTLSISGPAFFDTQFVEAGTYIEARNPAYGTPTLRTYDGSNSAMTIASVTQGNKRSSATAGTITVDQTITGGGTIADGDWITRKNAYRSTTSLEINGLMNLISDGSTNTGTYIGTENTANFTDVWSLDRTTPGNEYLQSFIFDVAGALDEQVVLGVLIEMENQVKATPNLFIVDPRSLADYFLGTMDDRRFNTMDSLTWVGGYKGLGVQIGSYRLMLTSLSSVPKGYAYIINTNNFAFITATNGYEWLTKGGRILTQKEGSDNQFATAVNDIQFVCYDPARQGKLHGITSTL